MPDPTETAHEPILLVFRYANADGKCSLCGRSRHLIAACCFEVRPGSRRRLYNGVELCPACLAGEREDAGRRVMRKLRREMMAEHRQGRTALERQNLRDARAYGDRLVAIAGRGGCRFPPALPGRWIAWRK
jgi:hypothetical protein